MTCHPDWTGDCRAASVPEGAGGPRRGEVEGPLGELGDRAERIAEERIRAALPAGVHCHAGVPFVAKTRDQGPAHDGEADLVLLHPEHGLLVLEVKSGEPRRDSQGRWSIGDHTLNRSPFEQAKDAKHDLVKRIEQLPDGPRRGELRSGHGVVFPDADLATLPNGHVLLGPDAPRELILDAEALTDARTTRAALDRLWAYWTGDGAKGQPLAPSEVEAVNAFLSPSGTIRRLGRRDVADAKDRLFQASRAQLFVLNQNRAKRRVEVIGPAGSGKSLVAVEKARRLAEQGYRTAFICFNQPLASAVMREFAESDLAPDRRPLVATFHGLCEIIGTEAGTLPRKPAKADRTGWFDATLPKALGDAVMARPERRFDAIVVDEGQDFELAWLRTLERLLSSPDDSVLWVFHDPGQALYRDDLVERLRLPDRLELFEDYRTPALVGALANRFYHGPTEPYPVIEGGRKPVVITAAAGKETVEMVRRRLHELTAEEGIRAWDIVVLSGQTAARSDVWRQRTFGNLVLWNGAIDDAGASLELPADQVPDEPGDADCVRFESIRRFKGLERPVVVVCELPEERERLDQLLYTAFTRATAQLIVIAPPGLAARLHGRVDGLAAHDADAGTGSDAAPRPGDGAAGSMATR